MWCSCPRLRQQLWGATMKNPQGTSGLRSVTAEKIRTILFLFCMIPVALLVGWLAVITVILATPVTLAGMVSWHLKIRAGEIARKKMHQNAQVRHEG